MSIQTFTHTFEGAPLVTLTWRGRPAWIARHIGERLGYAHGGKRLPNTILGEWSDEFIQGVDYAVLSGDDLAELKGCGSHHEAVELDSGPIFSVAWGGPPSALSIQPGPNRGKFPRTPPISGRAPPSPGVNAGTTAAPPMRFAPGALLPPAGGSSRAVE
jgi:hypothetical protein